jgi:predicted esterase
MHLYDYTVSDPHFDVQLAATTSMRSHYEVAFPSPSPVSWKGGNTVYGDLFVPQVPKQVPLVILTHGFGDASMAPCMALARLLIKQGIATFVWYLPTHSHRLPEAVKGEALPKHPGDWLEIYRSSVMEIRRIVDWASDRREIDPERISVAGFSMGGIISSIAMAVDARIYAGIFIVVGGNMAELSWGGESENALGGHGCSEEECRAAYSRYPEYLEEVASLGFENVVPEKECFQFDPLTFAAQLRGRPMLMINGRDDEIVSELSTTMLWEALGKPSLIWVPDTHVGTYCQSSLIAAEITNFLNSTT